MSCLLTFGCVWTHWQDSLTLEHTEKHYPLRPNVNSWRMLSSVHPSFIKPAPTSPPRTVLTRTCLLTPSVMPVSVVVWGSKHRSKPITKRSRHTNRRCVGPFLSALTAGCAWFKRRAVTRSAISGLRKIKCAHTRGLTSRPVAGCASAGDVCAFGEREKKKKNECMPSEGGLRKFDLRQSRFAALLTLLFLFARSSSCKCLWWCCCWW